MALGADASAPTSWPSTLGLLGAPGSGKSAAAAHLARRGFLVIDADAAARAALREPEVVAAVRERFAGTQPPVVDHADRIDRAALGARVFADPALRRWLERLVHPRVEAARREARRGIDRDAHPLGVVEDCPLLLETGLDRACDRLMMIDASRGVRLARVAARGWSATELERRDAAQWPLARKRAAADAVIVNEASLEALGAAIDEWLSEHWPPAADRAADPGAGADRSGA